MQVIVKVHSCSPPFIQVGSGSGIILIPSNLPEIWKLQSHQMVWIFRAVLIDKRGFLHKWQDANSQSYPIESFQKPDHASRNLQLTMVPEAG